MQIITDVAAVVTVVVAQPLRCVQLFGTPWTAARQAPLSSTTYRVDKQGSIVWHRQLYSKYPVINHKGEKYF